MNDDRSPKTTVYLVDDHILIRQALRSIISAESDMAICGEAEDGSRALQEIIKLQPDVVIVDISLKGNSGIELMKTVRSSYPKIRMIVLSMHAESIYGIRSLNAGAHGYCSKQDSPDRLIGAIRRVRGGGMSISDTLASHVLDRLSTGGRPNGASLTNLLSDREFEVAQLIGAGMTTQEIAIKLFISVKTVETHRAHIKEKLNLKNATQLIQTCSRWVEESESGRVPSPVDVA